MALGSVIFHISGVNGAVFKIRQVLQQAGQIYLYNLTDLSQQQNQVQEEKIPSPMATFSGNRRFGRFGAAIEVRIKARRTSEL